MKFVTMLAAVAAAWLGMAPAVAQTPAFLDTSLSAEERADDLLSRLTLDEKILLMMDVSPAIDRLGIPEYNWWNEALHGVGRAGLATVFPQCIGMAATFDDQAVYEAFDIVSDEARAKYNQARRDDNHGRYSGLSFWTPNINIFRDPRWGRGQETYGEDPCLTTRMGVAVVKGLQGPADAKYLKTLAGAKHYAVHSGPEWSRHRYDARDIDPRDLWETYLPAFKALVDAGVWQVMCAYNRYEGEPCCSNKRLLTQILRNDWGYDKIVVTDCWAVCDFYKPGFHETHASEAEASADAVVSGTDLECGPVFASLRQAYDNGKITEEKINDSVKRLLIARFRLGEIDDDQQSEWASMPYDVVDSPSHQAKALEMARKSMTLLKNNGILPLDRGASIAVMGPNAVDSTMQWGNYNGFPSHTVTVLQGIEDKVGNVPYLRGCELVALTDTTYVPEPVDAEIVIFVGGISPRLEGEEMPVEVPGFRGGDRETIELPAVQRKFLQSLKDQGKKVVFVNCSGSAIALTPEDEICDAILQAWYPGQAGGTAVADVLFGDYNPAGRLPVTFYKDDSQLPDFEDYNMDGRTYRYLQDEPLYPFGYGLSYTTFDYRNGRVAKDAAGNVRLSFDLVNTGDRNGDEVAQVYVESVDKGVMAKALRDFKRVNIEAGGTRHIDIELPRSAFETYDYAAKGMRVVPGQYRILYGPSSATTKSLTVRM